MTGKVTPKYVCVLFDGSGQISKVHAVEEAELAAVKAELEALVRDARAYTGFQIWAGSTLVASGGGLAERSEP